MQVSDGSMVSHVQPACALTSNSHEIAFEKHAKMLGYRRPTHIEPVGDIASGMLLLPHQSEDFSPGLVCKRPQLSSIHGVS